MVAGRGEGGCGGGVGEEKDYECVQAFT
jgi:hypothetical protein